MKIKRIANTVCAIIIALSVVSGSSAVAKLKMQTATENTAEIVSEDKSETVQSNSVQKSDSADKADKKTAYVNSVAEADDSNDIYYEPKEESVTVIEDGSAYINDAVTVFFTDDADEEDKQSVVESVNGEVVGSVDFMNEYEIKIQKSSFDELNSLCDELIDDESVEFASLSVATQTQEDYVTNDPWHGRVNWDDDANDYYYNCDNWWLKAVDADKAWDYNDYFSKINIGIVDSGFNTEHEDLQGRISFANDYFASHSLPSSHGTHVAGIIGALQDNGIGISGIVRDCNLVCVDWEADKEDNQKWNSDARILSGFVAAVKAGAKVVNFSVGSSGNITNGTTDRYQIIKDAEGTFVSYYVAKLLQKGYDFICCQSAGNGTTTKNDEFYAVDASNNGNFSCVTEKNSVKFVDGVSAKDIMDRIIIVAAVSKVGCNEYEQASYSNGGSQVTICAPGTDVLSTYYSEASPNFKYTTLSGTSMAAPVVTGIASMVWSVNQNFTGAQVKHFVCDKENTKIDVKDSSSESHLPTGTIPMVNAQLAVEAAIKATENNGTVSGAISMKRISAGSVVKFTVKNNDSNEVYRMSADENGNFSASLPEGSYTMVIESGIKDYTADFEIKKGEDTSLDTIIICGVTLDADSYKNVILNSMQGVLSFLQLY